MCSYCGCRSIKPIGDLSADHVQIQNLCGDVRRAVHNFHYEQAGDKLVQLAHLLHEHDAVEELTIYPAMARHTEYSDQVGTLFDVAMSTPEGPTMTGESGPTSGG